jgi:hypothetical protein
MAFRDRLKEDENEIKAIRDPLARQGIARLRLDRARAAKSLRERLKA